MKTDVSREYGLIAVAYLAKYGKDKLVLAKEIGKKYDITTMFLLQILQRLVRADVLRSKRGPKGGFWLARPAKNITLLEIIEAVEGPIVRDVPFIEQGRTQFVSRLESLCRKAAEKERAAYARVTLASLLAG